MRVRRVREVPAPEERVRGIVTDPWNLPRWWPGTARVEGVSGSGFSWVLSSPRGRAVRSDWNIRTRRPVRWAQELADSPFERLFARHEVVVETEAAGEAATRVAITIEQDPRGWARLAPFMLRRAAKRRADAALDGLAGLVAEPAD